MAIISLQSSASALSALNTALDVTSNNLANVNTNGFKPSRANFQDLLYVERQQPGSRNSTGDQRPIGLFVGLGVQVSGTQIQFTQGPPVSTDRELDIAIDGNGFFRVATPERPGGFAYTRAGSFTRNSDGEIVLANDTGYRLEPNIAIPSNARDLTIDRTGRVFARTPDAVEPQEIGVIELTTFINPVGLRPVGQNLFEETAASGPPITGEPQTENFGGLLQGYVEGSAVDPTRELVDLIRIQRAFEMNSNTIRAADETLKTISNLRR
jgi:flagellar basal-body rod protein FlgG